jgi:hypothetical protein
MYNMQRQSLETLLGVYHSTLLNEGFGLGLLLQLDLPHCIALGLIVFGRYGEFMSRPQQKPC